MHVQILLLVEPRHAFGGVERGFVAPGQEVQGAVDKVAGRGDGGCLGGAVDDLFVVFEEREPDEQTVGIPLFYGCWREVGGVA